MSICACKALHEELCALRNHKTYHISLIVKKYYNTRQNLFGEFWKPTYNKLNIEHVALAKQKIAHHCAEGNEHSNNRVCPQTACLAVEV